MKTSYWALLTLLSVLWGGTFFFVAIAVQEVPPLSVVLLRVLLASAILFVYLALRGEAFPRDTPTLTAFLVMGFLNNVIPFSLFFWAQTTISGGLASIINATTPVFSIVVAHFLLTDEKLTLNKVFGVALGVVGVAFLVGEEAFSGLSLAMLGVIACLFACLCQGFSVVYGRRFKSIGISSSMGALGQLLSTTLIMLPLVLVIDKPWTLAVPGADSILSIVGLATLSTALAYVVYFRLLATAGAVNTSIVTLLIPASAIFLGTTFLGESLITRHYLGLLFISVGLAAIDGRLLTRSSYARKLKAD